MVRHKVAPITRWEAATNQLEAWGVVCAVFLGNVSVHPVTYEVLGLLEEATGAGERIHALYHHQTTCPTAHIN